MNRDTFALKNKYFVANVDSEGVMTLPEEFLNQEDWRIGDDITFKIDPTTRSILMINSSKETRERASSK